MRAAAQAVSPKVGLLNVGVSSGACHAHKVGACARQARNHPEMDFSEARPERTIVEGQPLPGVETMPTVLDTAMLLDDVRAELNRGHPTALIEAARVGSLRLYVADHVFDEVERKLDPTRDDYTLRVRVDAAAMRAVWRRSYLPTIRFVEIHLALVSDPRITRLSAEDVSDAPTAALVILLGRCLSLSSDVDLIRHGFAESEWLRVALLGRDVARSEEMIISFQVGGGPSSWAAPSDSALSYAQTGASSSSPLAEGSPFSRVSAAAI